jgi:hypothetical protein
MTKKMITWGAITMMLCSAAACSSDIEQMSEEPQTKDITFRVIHKESESMTRAALADNISNLYYYRVSEGEDVVEQLQTSSDDNFGSISDNLKYGTHELYFIGTKSTITDFTEGVVSFDRVHDTFSYYVNLNVDKQTASNQSVELLRRIAKFELVATDALPDNLATMDITITGAATELDAKTGMGATETVQTKTINVPTSNIGKTDCTFAAYAFLLEDESSVIISVTAKDADGNTIVNYNFADVEMKTNYITRYSGRLFGDDYTMEVNLKAEWGGEIEQTF